MMQDYISLIIKSIRRRKLRSWLTIIGIVIGVASMVSLITIGQGMQNSIAEQFEKLGVRNIRIVPSGLQGPPGPGFTLPNDLIDQVERVRGVDYVDAVVTDSVSIEFDNQNRLTNIIGYDTELGDRGFVDTDVDVIRGRLFEATDSKHAILGYEVAKDMFDKEIKVKNSIRLRDVKFKVIGIFDKTGVDIDNRVYIPLDEARELTGQKDSVNVMVVKLLPGFDINEAAGFIEDKLGRTTDEELFDVLTPEQIVGRINQILGVLQTILGGIAGISLLVGAIGIMNSMFTSVLERTRQIGVMKAIGARNADVFFIFVVESGMIGLAGGAIGAAIGSAIALAAGFAAQSAGISLFAVRIDITVILAALSVSFAIGVVSGFYPAWKASRLRPVEALRYE